MSSMEVLKWPAAKAPAIPRSVATIGVFDGVHVGHRRILRTVIEEAGRRSVPSVVITFDRQPQQALSGRPEPCITSLEHRLRLFEQLGVRRCVVIGFTPRVAWMEAEDFARAVLRDLLHAELLVVGFDCRFGKERRGDVELLRRMAGELGLQTQVVKPVKVAGEVVSSTAIRQAVTRGELTRAKRLLGRPFSLLGTVVRGHGRGRRLGFPTANLDVHNELIPREGVYATRMLAQGERLASVTSVGRQETFQDAAGAAVLVEVHVLEGERRLYGRDVEVEFVRWLRDQRRFPAAEALIEQMKADCKRAKRLLLRSG